MTKRKESEVIMDLIMKAYDTELADGGDLPEYLSLLRTALRREQTPAPEAKPEPKAEAKPKAGPKAKAEPKDGPEAEAEPPAPRGRGAKLKRDTLRRLSDWRAVHGLGSYAILAAKSRGKLSETDIRDIAIGDHPIPLPKWQALSDALDKEGQK